MKVVRQARLELSGGSTPDLLRPPLICSFHSFMDCAGQIISAIARDHYFPSWLGTQHPRGTSAQALTAGSLISLGTLLVLHAFMGEERLGETEIL